MVAAAARIQRNSPRRWPEKSLVKKVLARTAIRDGRAKQIIAAATAFVEDSAHAGRSTGPVRDWPVSRDRGSGARPPDRRARVGLDGVRSGDFVSSAREQR